jgi:hypothetical protein
MNASIKSALTYLLRGMTWLFVAIAAFTALWGAAVINAFAKTQRILAEMEGFALAMLFGGLGLIAKLVEDHLEEDEGNEAPTSLGDAVRK